MTRGLFESDIKLGAIIWYGGATSTFGWNCPAEIYQIDYATRTFRVMSLDDMVEQTQDYTFDVEEHSPESRRSMYMPDPENVRAFLVEVRDVVTKDVLHKREQLRKTEDKLRRVEDYILKTIPEKV